MVTNNMNGVNNGDKIVKLEDDFKLLHGKVDNMEKDTVKFLHSLDKSTSLIAQSLKQTKDINEIQVSQIESINKRLNNSDKTMLEISSTLAGVSEGLAKTNERLYRVEDRFAESESKNKIDTRDLIMKGFLWLCSGGGLVIVVKEIVTLSMKG